MPPKILSQNSLNWHAQSADLTTAWYIVARAFRASFARPAGSLARQSTAFPYAVDLACPLVRQCCVMCMKRSFWRAEVQIFINTDSNKLSKFLSFCRSAFRISELIRRTTERFPPFRRTDTELGFKTLPEVGYRVKPAIFRYLLY